MLDELNPCLCVVVCLCDVCLLICLCGWLIVCVRVYVFVCVLAWLFGCLRRCDFVCVFVVSACVFVSVCVCLCVCLFPCLFVCCVCALLLCVCPCLKVCLFEMFLCVLPRITSSQCNDIAQRITQRINEYPFSNNISQSINVTVSIGIAHSTADNCTAYSLYTQAEYALNEFKRLGKNKVTTYYESKNMSV